MTGEKHGSALFKMLCGVLLLAAAPCAAQGIGPPAGVREFVVGLWGALGVLSGVALAIAFARERRHPNSRLGAALVWIVALYSLSAFACFFVVSEASKFTGTVGLIQLAFVARYFFRSFTRTRRASYAISGITLVALLLIPNAYWKIPLLTLTRIVYVDNLEGVATVRVLRDRAAQGGRLALEDGTLLMQTQHVPERRAAGSERRAPNVAFAELVELQPVSSAEPGRWYEVQHFDRRYVEGAYHDGQRARYVLGFAREHVDIWRPVSRTLGFVVDSSAPLAAEDIVVDMLQEHGGSWSDGGDEDPGNRYYWAITLLARGQLDLGSTRLLDGAFGQSSDSYGLIMLLDLGLSPVAQDSQGNTVLHFAAAQCDRPLLDALLDRPIDASIRNRRGQTALDVVRTQAAASPLYRCQDVQAKLEQEIDAAREARP